MHDYGAVARRKGVLSGLWPQGEGLQLDRLRAQEDGFPLAQRPRGLVGLESDQPAVPHANQEVEHASQPHQGHRPRDRVARERLAMPLGGPLQRQHLHLARPEAGCAEVLLGVEAGDLSAQAPPARHREGRPARRGGRLQLQEEQLVAAEAEQCPSRRGGCDLHARPSWGRPLGHGQWHLQAHGAQAGARDLQHETLRLAAEQSLLALCKARGRVLRQLRAVCTQRQDADAGHETQGERPSRVCAHGAA
mmetsp:Transcript_107598/g.347233  ORF Transcript_107598/g.347233 Transcript_107598/m.347233 type:complete len:249 (+) Transcript_107598:997-1743(+)